MNQKEVVNILKLIYEENADNNPCIFIDGDWGVGKTYSINSLKEEENEEIKFKYVSVFGKNELEQIEKDLIMQLLTITNKMNKIKDNNTIKLFGNIVTEALKIGGIDVNFSDLLNNLRIENIGPKFGERVVLCIDDLERKSPNVEIKDLLGLIERASTNYSVIFIANSAKFDHDDRETLNEYKEKLIDFQFTINQIDLETLEKVAHLGSNGLSIEIQKSISRIYLNNLNDELNQGKRLNNIRQFRKCIELIQRISDVVVEMKHPNDSFVIDEDIVILCMKVIDEYFHSSPEDTKKNWLTTNYKKAMYDAFRSIFLFEPYDDTVLQDYLIQNSEISKDVRKLYSGSVALHKS
ncbi:P-loop NTPase fold protein [Paenibacillus sp. YYML68]|uniref:P-loop NTPase fold protein n=1 Tax=Paenibacillus sp. YYML68 TaxID=2909250 RepID=UPI0024920C5E|nr:P-loop NTPase fold protein [Paenibacillus sp. YYML68]